MQSPIQEFKQSSIICEKPDILPAIWLSLTQDLYHYTRHSKVIFVDCNDPDTLAYHFLTSVMKNL